MTDMVPLVLDPATRTLDEIATSIRSNFMGGTEAQFAIGRDLLEARQQFPADRDFGQWFNQQQFQFARKRAWVLRLAAEHEDEVREVFRQRNTANFDTAVAVVVPPTPRVPKGVPSPKITRHNITEVRRMIRDFNILEAELTLSGIVPAAYELVRELRRSESHVAWDQMWFVEHEDSVPQVDPKE